MRKAWLHTCASGGKFVEYFNLNFSTNYNFTEISNYFISLLGDMPAVCAVDSVSKLIDFRNYYIEKYADYSMPRLLSNDLFTELFNREFTPQDNYTWGNIEDIYLLAGLSLNIYGPDVTSTLSCNKLTGLVVAYRAFKYVAAISSGGNPGGEQTAGEAIAIDEEAEKSYFTGMFNLYFHANYTYEQIVEYANSTCQIEDFNPIGTPSEEYLPIVTVDDPVSNVTEAWYPRLCGRVGPHVFPIPEPPGKCDYLKDMAMAIATEQYNAYVAQLYNSFDNIYLAKCLEAKGHETFTVSAPVAEYHYTLYYYDQAGNLVKTVPPEGVHPNFDETYLTSVHDARLTGATTSLPDLPQHTLVTQYRYNTLNQVVVQQTPDAGISRFYYDRLGRLAISQNAKQEVVSKYSYTIYDDLGRIKEVGQKLSTTVMTQVKCQNQEELFNWIYDNAFNKEQVTRTTYDLPAPNINPPPNPAPLTQVNLRNRVSFTQVFDEDPDNIADPPGIPNYLSHKSATYYSYDIHGNVDKLLQDYVGTMGAAAFPTGNRFKLITYNYDLISGKVNEVAYQPGMIDGFYHRYDYDAENRLTDVNTSRDGIYWEKDARYKYYRHGPLARSVLGEMQVQGLDYAYTLQGWLKGVNATTVLDGSKDIGLDGLVTGSGAPPQVARDIFGFSLNYFYGDYKPIILAVSGTFASVLPTGTDGLPATSSATDLMRTGHSLYNGNIASMVVNIPTMVGSTLTPGNPQVNGYRYDQLNRIVGMNTYTGLDNTTNIFTVPVNASVNYKERVIYDANGNILTYTRNGHTANTAGVNMDDLTYSYYAGTNKLKKVSDAIAPSNYADDIDDQAENENYEYDEIGNLIKDKAEGITNINWNVYGKISSITKFKNNVTTNIAYTYDASGNRISKDVNGAKTFYVRDASGNVMSLYTVESNINSGDLTQTEVHLFGSSRLGILNSNINVKNGLLAISNAGITTFTRGNKFFELSNHLGNVLVTVSDKKIAVAKLSPNQEEIDYYTADVITANDYYPGGMQMPGRKFSTGSAYRYGFNGKENDNEVKGEGNQIDYGMRIYDPRLGRFLSVDPLFEDYPWYTPYQFAGNSPIVNIDLDGEEEKHYLVTLDEKTGKAQFKFVSERPKVSVLWGLFKWDPPYRNIVEYKGKHYSFYGEPGTPNYDVEFQQIQTDPDAYISSPYTQSDEDAFTAYMIEAGSIVATGTFATNQYGRSKSVTTPNSQQKTKTEQQVQTQQAKPASQQKAATDIKRPTPIESENTLTPVDAQKQIAFKNGKVVPSNKKSSVRPDGYIFNTKNSFEVKNYRIGTQKEITNLVNNVVKQVRQRLSNLPKGSKQNVIVDVRGQNASQATLNQIRNKISTQAGSKNVNVQFKTSD